MKVNIAPEFFDSIKRLKSIDRKWYEMLSWFKFHFNKDFWRIIRTAFKGYPWQDNFLYELERSKIEEMMNYHKKRMTFVNSEYVVRDMRICLKLIDIMMNEMEYFTFDGDINLISTENGDYEMKPTDDFKYRCLVNVNTKNIDRFVTDKKSQYYYLKNPHELYLRKAKYLYHKIRYEHDGEWWD